MYLTTPEPPDAFETSLILSPTYAFPDALETFNLSTVKSSISLAGVTTHSFASTVPSFTSNVYFKVSDLPFSSTASTDNKTVSPSSTSAGLTLKSTISNFPVTGSVGSSVEGCVESSVEVSSLPDTTTDVISFVSVLPFASLTVT
ncbi:MAG: hypothetical protein MSA21_08425 [Lachnospiraceae bacterium]|nr:hypothetical protein [Lachnospiraceae bacterium]